ncbi:MAG TPA: winged helix-turn-helix domain-containing protein, partial [Acidimicrobiales bacterium]|nr:winged helix-turn-helix domain-containing protein [Acidimicrobiales bacterium]
DDAARSVTRAGQPVDLTRTEYDLLSTLLRHAGQVLSKRQLLVQVWGFDAFDPNVVEAHMIALRRKLEAHGPRVIHTVRGVGYLVKG